MSIKILCSLNVRNKNAIVRQIGTGILGPKQSGLFHFKNLSQVNHVLNLQKMNQVVIESPIPEFVSVQLNGGDTSAAPVTPATPVAPVETVVSLGKKTKPVWYLSWEEVERKEKKELQEWFEQNPTEGLSLPKNKNAAATKEIVHAFLAGQFEDHVAPKTFKEETPTESEELPLTITE